MIVGFLKALNEDTRWGVRDGNHIKPTQASSDCLDYAFQGSKTYLGKRKLYYTFLKLN